MPADGADSVRDACVLKLLMFLLFCFGTIVWSSQHSRQTDIDDAMQLSERPAREETGTELSLVFFFSLCPVHQPGARWSSFLCVCVRSKRACEGRKRSPPRAV